MKLKSETVGWENWIIFIPYRQQKCIRLLQKDLKSNCMNPEYQNLVVQRICRILEGVKRSPVLGRLLVTLLDLQPLSIVLGRGRVIPLFLILIFFSFFLFLLVYRVSFSEASSKQKYI